MSIWEAFELLQSVISIGSLVFLVGYGLTHKESDDDHHPWK